VARLLVYFREIVDLVYGVPILERGRNHEDALVCGVLQLVIARGHDVGLEPIYTTFHNCPNRFLYRFFEFSADCHHLSYTLHGAADVSRDSAEFLQVPAWHLHHHVIQARL
jgi:hypothetical protein